MPPTVRIARSVAGQVRVKVGQSASGTLAARVPPLLNGGLEGFTESIPPRDRPPLINVTPGAVEIQEFLDNVEWVGQAGDVVPYGGYLQRSPLEGVGPKSMIIQFSRGDRTLPNPTTTAILRAGDLADRATYYRFDLFLAGNPTTPEWFNDPHGLISIVPPDRFLPEPLPPATPMMMGPVTPSFQMAGMFAPAGPYSGSGMPSSRGSLIMPPCILPIRSGPSCSVMNRSLITSVVIAVLQKE